MAIELGDLKDAARRTENLLRRDPNFVDGRALLAAIREQAGRRERRRGKLRAALCPGEKSQRGAVFTDGIGGSDSAQLCTRRRTSSRAAGRRRPSGRYGVHLKSRDHGGHQRGRERSVEHRAEPARRCARSR